MPRKNNPEVTVLVYLIAFVVIFALILIAYSITQSIWVLVGSFVLGWIALVTIMTFQQRNDGVTEDGEFLETFKMVSHKIPPVSFFTNKTLIEKKPEKDLLPPSSESKVDHPPDQDRG